MSNTRQSLKLHRFYFHIQIDDTLNTQIHILSNLYEYLKLLFANQTSLTIIYKYVEETIGALQPYMIE